MTPEWIREYGRRSLENARSKRASLPMGVRMREYGLDWVCAYAAVTKNRSLRAKYQCRQVLSTPAWTVIRFVTWFRWR